jgi:hypothetical protein
MNDGVAIVLARMDTHPEEFYTTATEKWKFIYSDYFRDAMSETEKGMIFDKLKEIRKAEFTAKVMLTMTRDDKHELESFGKAHPLREGSRVNYT